MPNDRWYYIRLRYGLSRAEVEAKLEEQGHVCAICQGPPRGRHKVLCVDHCHDTGKFRGMLCATCNHAISMIGDTEESAQRAAAYLCGTM